MEAITLNHYLLTGALLFGIGVIGFVSRRNLIVMFLCTEMMFQCLVLALVQQVPPEPRRPGVRDFRADDRRV